jgi:hypothetical protein
VTDRAGNEASVTLGDINVDKTAPTISASRNNPANGNGWNNSDVTVSFVCGDLLSGTASCSLAQVFGEGAAQSATGTVTDLAGNTASTTLSGINVDKTAPTIVAQRNVAANANGWNNSDVTVSFVCSDALSGAASCSPTQLFGEGAGQSASGTVTDLAGNSASTTLSGINVDKTAPTISASRDKAPNANGWNNSDVTVSFVCTDGLSGTASCSATQVFGEGAAQSARGTVTDLAGNTASTTLSGINVDKTAPTLVWGAPTPAPNAAGWNNTDVTIPYTIADGLSGVGTAPTSSSITLTTEGASVTGTVTVTDLAGNTTTFTSTPVKIDKTAGTGTMVINGDAAVTSSPTVTVTLNFADTLSGPTQMRFSSDGSTWTAFVAYAATVAFTLPAGDGTKTVYVQVVDAAGNTTQLSDTITLTTATTTPPTVTVTGVINGQTYGVCLCAPLTFRYTITSGSTLNSQSATLDGKPIASGATIDTFYLNAGAHKIVVTATNAAGTTTTVEVSFEVHVTIEDLECAVHRAVALGLVSRQQEQALIAKLEAAKASRDRGNTTSEINQLQAFIHDLQAQRGKKIDPAFDDRAVGWTNDLIARVVSGVANSATCVDDDEDEHDDNDDHKGNHHN